MLHSFFTLALDADEGSISVPRPAALLPGKMKGFALNVRLDGPQSVLDASENKIVPALIRNPDPPSRAPVTVPTELVIFHVPHSLWRSSLFCLLFTSLRIPLGGGDRVGAGPSGVRIPLETSGFYLSQNVQTSSGAPKKTSYSVGTFPGLRRQGREVKRSPPSSTEVTYEWSSAFDPLNAELYPICHLLTLL